MVRIMTCDTNYYYELCINSSRQSTTLKSISEHAVRPVLAG